MIINAILIIIQVVINIVIVKLIVCIRIITIQHCHHRIHLNKFFQSCALVTDAGVEAVSRYLSSHG